tara:strand:- start:2522 stop:2854 length:333 start_codon:yes stop_codon:yes gene_type:complete
MLQSSENTTYESAFSERQKVPVEVSSTDPVGDSNTYSTNGGLGGGLGGGGDPGDGGGAGGLPGGGGGIAGGDGGGGFGAGGGLGGGEGGTQLFWSVYAMPPEDVMVSDES